MPDGATPARPRCLFFTTQSDISAKTGRNPDRSAHRLYKRNMARYRFLKRDVGGMAHGPKLRASSAAPFRFTGVNRVGRWGIYADAYSRERYGFAPINPVAPILTGFLLVDLVYFFFERAVANFAKDPGWPSGVGNKWDPPTGTG